jgi:hypothetical protein
VLIALAVRSYSAKLITTNRADFELIREFREFGLEVWQSVLSQVSKTGRGAPSKEGQRWDHIVGECKVTALFERFDGGIVL